MLLEVSQIFYCLVCEIKPLECRGLLPPVRSDLLPRSVWPSSRLSCLGSLESLSVHSHLQHHRQLLVEKVTETPNWRSSCMIRLTNSQSVINRLLWRCCNCKHAWFNSSWPMFHWYLLFWFDLMMIQKEVAKPHIHVTDMKKSIQNYLKDSGWEIKLQNAVYFQLKR